MIFREILLELVGDTDAAGALFVDSVGEVVELVEGSLDTNRLSLLGAYVGIYTRQVSRFLHAPQWGELEVLRVENRDLVLLALPLRDGYVVVLVLPNPTLAARSERALRAASQRLVAEAFVEG